MTNKVLRNVLRVIVDGMKNQVLEDQLGASLFGPLLESNVEEVAGNPPVHGTTAAAERA